MTDCDGCVKWVSQGPNIVPWGDTQVDEGDAFGCVDGYDGDCPDGAYEPCAGQSDRQDEEFWERADYEHDLEREDRS